MAGMVDNLRQQPERAQQFEKAIADAYLMGETRLSPLDTWRLSACCVGRPYGTNTDGNRPIPTTPAHQRLHALIDSAAGVHQVIDRLSEIEILIPQALWDSAGYTPSDWHDDNNGDQGGREPCIIV